MPTHLALLRGVNVGGRNNVAMAELRRAVAELGHRDVATYIQSGNVLFTPGALREPNALADELERLIDERLGVRSPVIVVTHDRLATIVGHSPFPGEANPKALHAVFLREPPAEDAEAAVAAAVARARAKGGNDDAQLVAGTLYLWTPDGLGRSRLATELGRARSGEVPPPSGTARNWATVTTLLGLLSP